MDTVVGVRRYAAITQQIADFRKQIADAKSSTEKPRMQRDLNDLMDRTQQEIGNLATFPGLAIMLTVLAVNLLGDYLRDWLDPRLRNTVRGDQL